MKNDVFKIFLFSKESGSWVIKVKDKAKWILGAGGLVFFILIICLLLKNSLTSPTRRKRTWNGKDGNIVVTSCDIFLSFRTSWKA